MPIPPSYCVIRLKLPYMRKRLKLIFLFKCFLQFFYLPWIPVVLLLETLVLVSRGYYWLIAGSYLGMAASILVASATMVPPPNRSPRRPVFAQRATKTRAGVPFDQSGIGAEFFAISFLAAEFVLYEDGSSDVQAGCRRHYTIESQLEKNGADGDQMTTQKKRVLITGTGGYLGRALFGRPVDDAGVRALRCSRKISVSGSR